MMQRVISVFKIQIHRLLVLVMVTTVSEYREGPGAININRRERAQYNNKIICS